MAQSRHSQAIHVGQVPNSGRVLASALPEGRSIKAVRGWADNAPSGWWGESTGVVSEMPVDPIWISWLI